MKLKSRIFYFIFITLIFLTGYGYFVFAAPPGTGGYNPGETLDPDCSPGDLVPNPCIVKSPIVTGDNGLTVSGSNIQLGGSLLQDTLIDTDGHSFSIGANVTGGLDAAGIQVGSAPGISAVLLSGGSTTANGSVTMGVYSYGIGAFAGMNYTDNTTGNTSQIGVNNNEISLNVLDVVQDESNAFFINDTGIFVSHQESGWGPDQGVGFLVNQTGFQVRGSNPISGYNSIWAVYDPAQSNNIRENAFLYNNGNWQWTQYPATRDDSSATTPGNILYTDTGGNVLSAPLSSIVPVGISGLQNSGKDIALGGTLTQDATIYQDGFNITFAQPVSTTGNIITTQGLTRVTGQPGTVTGYVATNGDAARHITWVTGPTNNIIKTLSGSGDPSITRGGSEIYSSYDTTDTASAVVGLYTFDTPNGKVSRLRLTPDYFDLDLGVTGELRLGGNAGNAGYVITSNGAGVAPTWQDPAMLISDERLKSNITDLPTNALDKISQLRTVSYTLNADTTNRTQIGFLAQDLEQYFPELVGQRPDGYKGVYYAQMTPVLVEAIRELHLQMTTIDNMTQDNLIRNSFIAWMGNQLNGITHLYAEIVHTKKLETEQLCIKDVCMDRDQLYNIMQSSSTPIIITAPTIVPDSNPEPVITPDPQVDPGTNSEPSPSEPVPEMPIISNPEVGN